MFGPFIIIILAVVEQLETTRVSRIKPTHLNHQSRNNNRYQTPFSSTLNYNDSYPTEMTTIYPSSRETSQPDITPCDKPFSCKDCTTFRLCIPSAHGFTELITGHCPVDRPYCDHYSGTCVSHISTAIRCGSPDPSFLCTSDGQFPHPTDPTKYFICSELKAYGYSCREGYKYYAPSSGCSKFTWITNPFECSELNATKVLYTNGGSYFAYCVNGKPYIVSSCLENEFFNVTTQVCEPQCNSEFVVADVNNCVKYFKCSKIQDSLSYLKESLDCPNGEGFHSSLKKCVPLSQLPNCKPINIKTNNNLLN